MATATYKVLGQALATTSNVAVVTVAAGKQYLVSTIGICNITAGSVLLSLDTVPGGGAPAAKNAQLRDQPIAPGDPIFITIGATLEQNDEISIKASANSSIAVTVYGTVIG